MNDKATLMTAVCHRNNGTYVKALINKLSESIGVAKAPFANLILDKSDIDLIKWYMSNLGEASVSIKSFASLTTCNVLLFCSLMTLTTRRFCATWPLPEMQTCVISLTRMSSPI